MSENPRWAAEHGRMVLELAVATAAAAVAIYVRGIPKDGPKVALRDRLVSGACEALVCGFFAGGVSALAGWYDQRSTYALAAAFAYVGLQFLREIFQRIASRKADTL